MYSIVEKLLSRLESADSQNIEISTDDTRLATAVLLYRVIHVDGRIREVEVDLYRRILEDKLHVTADELELFESTVAGQSDAEHTMTPFINLVRKLPEDKKREIIALMHDISVIDNELHEFEVNLVARAMELLDIEN